MSKKFIHSGPSIKKHKAVFADAGATEKISI
jgi:hypothetical protein